MVSAVVKEIDPDVLLLQEPLDLYKDMKNRRYELISTGAECQILYDGEKCTRVPDTTEFLSNGSTNKESLATLLRKAKNSVFSENNKYMSDLREGKLEELKEMIDQRTTIAGLDIEGSIVIFLSFHNAYTTTTDTITLSKSAKIFRN